MRIEFDKLLVDKATSGYLSVDGHQVNRTLIIHMAPSVKFGLADRYSFEVIINYVAFLLCQTTYASLLRTFKDVHITFVLAILQCKRFRAHVN